MESRGLVAIVLCVLFYLGYSYYLESKFPGYREISQQVERQPSNKQLQTTLSPSTESAITQTKPSIETEQQVKLLDAESLQMESEGLILQFDQGVGGLKSIQLKNYRGDVGSEDRVELIERLLRLEGLVDLNQPPQRLQQTLTNLPAMHAEIESGSVTMWRVQDKWKISNQYSLHKEFGLEIKVTFENQANSPRNLVSGLVLSEDSRLGEDGGSFLIPAPNEGPKVVLSRAKDVEHEEIKSFCDDNTVLSGQQQSLDFIGYERHYFLKAVVPSADAVSYKAFSLSKPEACPTAVALYQDQGRVKPGEAVTMSFYTYFGPKITDQLKSHHPRLESAVDFGFFSFLSHPLLQGINFIYRFIGNYGLAIILMTVLLKLAFYPLVKQQQISAIKMKKLQPEMTRLREKYKSNPQAQQMELLKFMKEHKVNPMKGCLPILPQIPVFMAYYWMLMNAIELRHAPFFGWIQDLSIKDPYFITPILMGIGMFLQQKLTPMAGIDKNQEKILMFMPIMFSLLMLTLPAGMVIYMLTNTVVSIAQQQWLNRRLENSGNAPA